MKFTVLGFSQARLVELKLKLNDALILRWFVDFQATGRMCEFSHPDHGVFYQIKGESLLKDLPVLGITSARGLKKRFENLVAAGVLESYTHKEGGTFSCYRIGKNYESLVANPSEQKRTPRNKSSDPPEQKFRPPRNKSSEQKNTSTINQSTRSKLSSPDGSSDLSDAAADVGGERENPPCPPSLEEENVPGKREYNPKTAHTVSNKGTDYECAEYLAKQLIKQASAAYGKKLIAKPSGSIQPIIKLFKAGVKPQECLKTLRWLYLTNASSDYPFRVESGNSLLKKWDRIQTQMAAEQPKRKKEQTYIKDGWIYFPDRDLVCGQVPSRKVIGEELKQKRVKKKGLK